MQLEEMKSLWNEMSMEIEKQKKLTGSIIINMTHTRYRNKISKILIPETIGALICIAGATFVLINIQKLNTWYLLVSGIVSVLVLVVLPILSVRAIRSMQSVNILDNNYKESLLTYSKSKIRFVFVQKLSFYLGAVLMVTILPVMGLLIGGKDLLAGNDLWLWYAVGFPFLYIFYKWVYKSYIKATTEAENILRELEN